MGASRMLKHAWTSAGTILLMTVAAAPAIALPTAQDVAQQAGIYEVNISFDAAAADYNGDGRTDLWIGYHNKGGKLFRNDGGVFTRVAPTLWPARVDRHRCAWADVNVDGRLDMYCTVGRTAANNVKDATHDNELWLQQSGGSFTDVGTVWGVGDPYGRGRATTFIDANGDRYPDLFVGNELPRSGDPGTNGENKLFINNAGAGFTRDPSYGLDQFVGAFCAHAFDYDRDGWQDLFLCGSTRSVLYHNNAGQGFSDVTASSGIGTVKRKDVDVGDLNQDGTPDAIEVTGTAVKYQLNNAGLFGTIKTIRTLTAGQAVAVGDADGNGTLDIYALQTSNSTGNLPDYILLNNNLRFTTVQVPGATGSGDTVEPLDYNGNGTTDFAVLNGRLSSAGPTQLIKVTAG
jgi:hypothetical protein